MDVECRRNMPKISAAQITCCQGCIDFLSQRAVRVMPLDSHEYGGIECPMLSGKGRPHLCFQ